MIDINVHGTRYVYKGLLEEHVVLNYFNIIFTVELALVPGVLQRCDPLTGMRHCLYRYRPKSELYAHTAAVVLFFAYSIHMPITKWQ